MKLWICIGLSLIFLMISLRYWNSYNSNSVVPALQKDVLEMVQYAGKYTYESDTTKPEQIRVRLSANKLIGVVSPAIRQLYSNVFIPAWGRKLVTADTVQLLTTKFTRLFAPVIISAPSVKNNQLLCMIVISILFSLLLALIMYTSLLRDPVTSDTRMQWQQQQAQAAAGSGKPMEEIMPPFSLAKTQLAFWITIIASFYIYSYLWNLCEIEKLNQTALILMGISAGTFAAGAILDTNEIQQGIPRSQNERSSGNFFKDILSDKDGVSIHRLQNFVWTLIAIVIYFYRYNNPIAGQGCLPELESTLLALTGISSATYLTLKSRENMSVPTPIAQVTVQLALPATLPAPPTFVNAGVTLQDKSGGAIIAAAPAAVAPNFNFLANKVTPDTYTIKATWNGKDAAGNPVALTGSAVVVLDSKTPMPINIQLQ